jgi:CO/xanthine dehydrogenase FAD-binding subunit
MTALHYTDLEVISVESLNELLDLLAKMDGNAVIIAGGTDIIPLLRKGRTIAEILIDVSKLKELKFIKYDDSFIRIGALTTLSELLLDFSIKKHLPLLYEALLHVGTWQVRNLATIGGNLGRITSLHDVLVALYALDAKVKLLSKFNERIVDIKDIIEGVVKFDKREIIAEILVQPMSNNDIWYYKKLSRRVANAIASASIALLLKRDPVGPCNKFITARIVLGGAAVPIPIRIREAEEMLCKDLINNDQIEKIANIVINKIKPRSGALGSAEFKKLAARSLVIEGLKTVLSISCN